MPPKKGKVGEGSNKQEEVIDPLNSFLNNRNISNLNLNFIFEKSKNNAENYVNLRKTLNKMYRSNIEFDKKINTLLKIMKRHMNINDLDSKYKLLGKNETIDKSSYNNEQSPLSAFDEVINIKKLINNIYIEFKLLLNINNKVRSLINKLMEKKLKN